MVCREGCAACCISPSISSPIPGMPSGKPAGEACIQLENDFTCKIHGSALRPAVCSSLQAQLEMCGTNKLHALAYLTLLEKATAPS